MGWSPVCVVCVHVFVCVCGVCMCVYCVCMCVWCVYSVVCVYVCVVCYVCVCLSVSLSVCLKECDLETSTVRRPRAEMGCCPHKEKKKRLLFSNACYCRLLEKASFYSHGKPTGCFHHKDGSENQVWL